MLEETPRKTTTLLEAGIRHIYRKKHNFLAVGQWMFYHDQIIVNERVYKKQRVSPLALEKVSFWYMNNQMDK